MVRNKFEEGGLGGYYELMKRIHDVEGEEEEEEEQIADEEEFAIEMIDHDDELQLPILLATFINLD